MDPRVQCNKTVLKFFWAQAQKGSSFLRSKQFSERLEPRHFLPGLWKNSIEFSWNCNPRTATVFHGIRHRSLQKLSFHSRSVQRSCGTVKYRYAPFDSIRWTTELFRKREHRCTRSSIKFASCDFVSFTSKVTLLNFWAFLECERSYP